jgi:hypothetical protein
MDRPPRSTLPSRRLGGLDLLVVNSGGPDGGTFDEIDEGRLGPPRSRACCSPPSVDSGGSATLRLETRPPS